MYNPVSLCLYMLVLHTHLLLSYNNDLSLATFSFGEFLLRSFMALNAANLNIRAKGKTIPQCWASSDEALTLPSISMSKKICHSDGVSGSAPTLWSSGHRRWQHHQVKGAWCMHLPSATVYSYIPNIYSYLPQKQSCSSLPMILTLIWIFRIACDHPSSESCYTLLILGFIYHHRLDLCCLYNYLKCVLTGKGKYCQVLWCNGLLRGVTIPLDIDNVSTMGGAWVEI